MAYRAVLFDAAETLVTTRGTVGEIYQELALQFGSTATPAEIQEAFLRHFKHSGPLRTADEKQWWHDVVFRVFTEVGMVRDFDRFFDQVYDQFRGSRGWRLFPETREVLTQLQNRQLKLGIVSNFDSRIYSMLQDLGIRSFFHSVTISSEAGYAKPAPEIFHQAIRSIGLPAADILFVGDNPSDDVAAATASGIDAVLVDRGGHHAGMVSMRRIGSLREILDLLAGTMPGKRQTS